MSKQSTYKCRAATLGACLSIAAVASPAAAFCRLTTEMPLPEPGCSEEGIGLFWSRQCISYSMMERADAESPPFERVRDVADLSFGAWLGAECDGDPLPLRIAQTQDLAGCDEPEYNTVGPNANTIMFIEDWSERELPDEAFGLTLVWHDPQTGEIFDADMQINETLGRLSICDPDCSRSSVDLQNVVTHEAGHFLGLGHSQVRAATMSARAELGETAKRTLEDDDVEGVCSIYGELSQPSCSEADFQPDQGFSSECSVDTRSSCDCTAPGSPRSGAPPILLLALAFLTSITLLRRL